jgi:phosphatidylglycerol:prolipoprotein diacylglycerol transferase
MFPYFDTSQWHVGTWSIHPFVIFVVLGCTTSYQIVAQRVKRYGISQERISEFSLWLFGVGFTGARLVYPLYMYDPATLMAALHHPLRLITFFGGVSSFGGFAGGIIGAATFFRVRGIPRTEAQAIRDSVYFSTPFGWSIARVGCYLMHDHPGVRTSSWLGVRYPGGTRYDLGLLEILFLLAQGGAFLLLDRKPRPPGFFAAAMLIPYGVFRLLQDPLHVDEAKYFGWTVDQIAATAMIAFGLAYAASIYRVKYRHAIIT